MIEDRDYMRQPEYRDPIHWPRWPRWSWTLGLLIAYAVVFIVEWTLFRFFPDTRNYYGYFALSKEGLEHGFVWQLVTYQFMHAGFWHLALNSWAIYVFGRELESFLGGKKFLALVFSSGIVGGVFQILTAIVWPELFDGRVVGASACAFGLVAAFAMLYPERELMILIFFVIPVRMRAKTLLILSGVLAVAGIVFSESVFGGNVANAAHLGGMAMGWFFVRKILQGDWSRLTGTLRPPAQSKPCRPSLEPLGKKSGGNFVEEQVDPILEKISAHGIQSLTPREREILEAARQKMTRS